MFVLMKFRMSSKIGHVMSKTRLLVQILEKSCVGSRGHIFSPITMKLGQNVCYDELSNEFGKWVMWGQKLDHKVIC